MLDDLHDECRLDDDSIRILPSGLTPQIERMVVVADCVGEKRLIGVVVSGETSDPEPDEDYTIAPESLPGGTAAGQALPRRSVRGHRQHQGPVSHGSTASGPDVSSRALHEGLL